MYSSIPVLSEVPVFQYSSIALPYSGSPRLALINMITIIVIVIIILLILILIILMMIHIIMLMLIIIIWTLGRSEARPYQ